MLFLRFQTSELMGHQSKHPTWNTVSTCFFWISRFYGQSLGLCPRPAKKLCCFSRLCREAKKDTELQLMFYPLIIMMRPYPSGVLWTKSCLEILQNVAWILKKKIQHTPGTYPRLQTNSLWRNSFHLRVWGCLGYAPGVCWCSLRWIYFEWIWGDFRCS